MAEDEDERDVQGLREAVGVCEAPCEGSEGEQQTEEICEGGVGAVVGFGGLFLYQQLTLSFHASSKTLRSYMVIYLSKHFLGRNN